MAETEKPFRAIVLAGKRPGKDVLAEAAGVACKSFVPIGDRPMIHRVLDALATARQVGSQILCGPAQAMIDQEPELKARIESGEVKWIDSHSTPSLSTYHALQSIPQNAPILVTTADHALLSPQIVDYFCTEARRMNGDLVVGLTPYEGVVSAFPETKRTAIKFKDGRYSGCNLFGFLNPDAYRAAKFWRQIEQERKQPLKMIRILGWWAVMRYLTGRTTLDQGLEQISRKLQIRIRAILLPFPQAAVDVDTAADWQFVQNLVKNRAF